MNNYLLHSTVVVSKGTASVLLRIVDQHGGSITMSAQYLSVLLDTKKARVGCKNSDQHSLRNAMDLLWNDNFWQ